MISQCFLFYGFFICLFLLCGVLHVFTEENVPQTAIQLNKYLPQSFNEIDRQALCTASRVCTVFFCLPIVTPECMLDLILNFFYSFSLSLSVFTGQCIHTFVLFVQMMKYRGQIASHNVSPFPPSLLNLSLDCLHWSYAATIAC